MQACTYGHWEVVQTLLLFKCNVTRADYLSGRTALHFSAMNGHVRCMRLVVADFIPSIPFDSINASDEVRDDTIVISNRSTLSKFINKTADGGITALHMAALNGYFDCVQLLLDIHANVSAVTFPYGTSVDLIGTGSTPLHYAARGGNLKCCQILLANGASRLTLNNNGWLPLDVAKMWGRHWLEPLLDPNAATTAVPVFRPSSYLSLPLMSVLNIARDYGLHSSTKCSDDADICAVCLERLCTVAAEGCGHKLCVRCALCLCSTSVMPSESRGPAGSIPCPLCRHSIVSFVKLPTPPPKELNKVPMSLSLCTPSCIPYSSESDVSTRVPPTNIQKNRVASVSQDLFCPVTCSPFPSVSMPMCPSCERHDDETQDGLEESMTMDQKKIEGVWLEKVSCSSMFWSRRSCSREHQCNAEISA
ncbi:E3 ubiquitin-protein ligase XBAT33-like isoform X2 [Impatiens glandulifera]|nr:E3 ubiquitin-protein ligase XBAT33-like isoform X2 [Impatiens glandulifera]